MAVLKLPGLVLRGGVWTFRRVVPEKLRPVVGAREIWRSLGTADLDLAQARWKVAREEVARSFTEGAPCAVQAFPWTAPQPGHTPTLTAEQSQPREARTRTSRRP